MVAIKPVLGFLILIGLSHTNGYSRSSTHGAYGYEYYLNGDDIGSLLLAGRTLWVGTSAGGIVRRTVEGDSVEFLNAANSNLPSNRVKVILANSKGEILARTVENQSGLGDRISLYNGKAWTSLDTTYSTNRYHRMTSLAVDSNGVEWIGTDSGLVRSIGADVQRFTKSNSGLLDNKVTALLCPRKGEVWVGTQEGIGIFKDASWYAYTNTNTPMKSNLISDFTMDDKGSIYVATRNYSTFTFPPQNIPGGLSKFDGQKWENLLGISVNALAFDSANGVWAATVSEGVKVIKPNAVSTLDSSNTPFRSNSASDILIAGAGRVFVGLRNSSNPFDNNIAPDNGGLFENQGGTWKKVATSNSGLPSNAITALSLGKDGKLWIGGKAGVTTYTGGKWDAFGKCSDRVNTSWVYSLSVDSANNAWIGYGNLEGFGFLCKAGPASNLLLEPPGDTLERIYDIEFDGKKNVWLGAGNSLVKYDGSDWTVFGDSTAARPIPRNPGHGVYRMTVGLDEKIWFTIGAAEDAPNQEVVAYNGSGFTNFNKGNTSLLPDMIVDLRVNRKDGTIWAASNYNGVFEYNGNAWRVVVKPDADIPSRYIRLLGFDRDGKVLATVGHDFGGGLYSFDGSQWTSLVFSNSPLPHDRITAFAEDESGNYWLGTDGGGLIRVSKNQGPISVVGHPRLSKRNRSYLMKDFDLRGRRLQLPFQAIPGRNPEARK